MIEFFMFIDLYIINIIIKIYLKNILVKIYPKGKISLHPFIFY